MTPQSIFERFFLRAVGVGPYRWQSELGTSERCQDRQIRVPTGFGKTAGVVMPWLFHRVERDSPLWPRRLVLTLPMRVLVEQTELEIRRWIDAAGLNVPVHVLMGGAEIGPWHLDVEKPAVLIGTQDMVLSRALNRGFGAARARWPVDFGLLHHDALWVLDEVQLMDVGLATSVQLAQFRHDDRARLLRQVHTWWMSATLQPRWMETVDTRPRAETLAREMVSIPASERSGGLWEVRKALERRPEVVKPAEVAQLALERHQPGTVTLVILNRVARAVEVKEALAKALGGRGAAGAERPETVLVHSRFRGQERAAWDRFLRRDAEVPPQGRIIVATQVVEAGVDISARILLTDLAPWPSLVQRFGRCARYAGETGTVFVVGTPPDGEKDAAPYDLASMRAADAALAAPGLDDVSPSSLEEWEERLPDGALATLYPYSPLHVLRRHDVDELFDTAPDLSGADLDVSRYIRSGEERDVTLLWRSIDRDERGRAFGELPARSVPPAHRDELCRAPIAEVRKWLPNRLAYVRDYRLNAWTRLSNDELFRRVQPGTTVLVDSAEGGYDLERGWDGRCRGVVPPVAAAREESHDDLAAGGEEDDALSEFEWQSIGDHVLEVGAEARALCMAIGLPERIAHLLELAGRWHDVGKSHRVFQQAIREDVRRERGGSTAARDLAKAPRHAWRRPAYPERPGFRHELASTLALLALVRRANQAHAGLLGPWLGLLEALGEAPDTVDEPPIAEDHPLASALCALSGPELDLVAYLVCSHHGKVRCAWTGTSKDLDGGQGAIHGVCEGDELPELTIGDATLPSLRLSLAPAAIGLGRTFGASWSDRVAGLLKQHGPFTLAYLEAVLRAADVRVSLRLGGGEK